MYDDEVIKLRHPLYAPRCPAIENTPKQAASGAKWRPTSIMEPMDIQHCIWALTHSGFWEGAVSIWNLDSFQTKAFDIDLNLKGSKLASIHGVGWVLVKRELGSFSC